METNNIDYNYVRLIAKLRERYFELEKNGTFYVLKHYLFNKGKIDNGNFKLTVGNYELSMSNHLTHLKITTEKLNTRIILLNEAVKTAYPGDWFKDLKNQIDWEYWQKNIFYDITSRIELLEDFNID